MSAQNPTEQVKFLVVCIGHTQNGRPDFQAVANDLGIVSKAAAQKRYERMLKAYGVTGKPNGNGNGNKSSDEKAAPKVSPTKRKANGGESKSKKANTRKTKAEPESPGRSETSVKDEADEEEDASVIADTAQHDAI